MKRVIYIIGLALFCLYGSFAQEYATFQITGTHQGSGSFINAALSDFSWAVSGTLNGEVQILDNEVFDDGNAFENIFGQADNAQNLRIQVAMNGAGTNGQPLTSSATLTLFFDQVAPPDAWGFCVVDIDVENCLFSATDENDNQVPPEVIDGWLMELFDADLNEDGINIPKWDATHAALLGSDTPEDYIVYNNLVIGGMPSSEAPAAGFMPDIPLKSLTITFENLQDIYNTSYHFYIASLETTSVSEFLLNYPEVYPVPASDNICISLKQTPIPDLVVDIMNASGNVLIHKKPADCNGVVNLNISALPAGVYFCRIYNPSLSYVKKIIKP
ncbi:T9SS type A sorting domain-containing protein [Lentimicrobium sp.]|uniref:T9SS type A sorting domain-containing protein n=1 Tax=Lentimicrobium sp. TaxID=2034841 RepID=UPI002C8E3CF7|nr:T9SS type A sorting domain-containing protein [Lentimicrobium sp.]HRW70551.1 T9SS type A sorting domain-containing protein [Lentimicrobium sp.]